MGVQVTTVERNLQNEGDVMYSKFEICCVCGERRRVNIVGIVGGGDAGMTMTMGIAVRSAR